MKSLCLALCLCTTPAFAIDTCEIDLRVTTADGGEATIIGGPVAEMCIIRAADGNMMPVAMSTLTASTTPPPPRDVRSITEGIYTCRAPSTQSTDPVITVQMNADLTYAVADDGGTWKAYDDLSIQFLDGPLANTFVGAQNSMLMFGATETRPEMFCTKS
ncbi:MAG: hypothetical protein ACOH2M_19490 [Cypionkella sp.]